MKRAFFISITVQHLFGADYVDGADTDRLRAKVIPPLAITVLHWI
jgi:hypothetical protein